MRRRLSFTCGLVCALILAGCTASETLIYDVTLDVQDDAKALSLLLDLEQVVERQASAQADIAGIAVTTTPRRGNRGLLTVGGIKSKEQAESVKKMLAEPFTFEIKREVAPKKASGSGNVTNVERAWETTGITGADLAWVKPVTQPKSGAVGIELTFNDDGKKLFQKLFKEHQGATIGIFVRDLLISQLTIDADNDISDRIVITGVPNAEVAEVFADDVNVGLHTHLSLR